MLIEVKVKITYLVDDKERKTTETYVVDKITFPDAWYEIATMFGRDGDRGITDWEVLSMRQSSIKEIATQYEGQHAYMATLKDIYHDDNGSERSMRYKVLLWADDLTSATHNVRELQRQGYDMIVEGLREVDYTYIE